MDEISYSISADYDPDKEVYIHIPQHDITIRVSVPPGHSIEDLDLAFSYGEGWVDIKKKE